MSNDDNLDELLTTRREALAKSLEALKAARSGEEFKYPSVLQMAKNLAASGVEVVAQKLDDGDIRVEEEEFLDRLEICTDCDLLDPDQVRCTHESCGCFLMVKGHLAAVTCPLYMWPGDTQKALLGIGG